MSWACPYGSVAGSARPCLPTPSQHQEVLPQVGGHLSLLAGGLSGEAMESSTCKTFRPGSGACVAPCVSDPHDFTNTDGPSVPKGQGTLNRLKHSPYPEKPMPRMGDRQGGLRVIRATTGVGTGSAWL